MNIETYKLNTEDAFDVDCILQVMKHVQCPKCNKTVPEGMKQIDTILGTDGLVGRYKDAYLALCFAGSNEIMDWAINLAKGTGENRLHNGFYAAAEAAIYYTQIDLLGKYYTNRLENDKFLGEKVLELDGEKIYIGGYSNGAAIAALVAARLSLCGFNVVLATWGQPKFAEKERVGYLGLVTKYYRFNHPYDPVTHVPIALVHQENAIDIRTGGYHWFPHSFDQYYKETKRIIKAAYEHDVPDLVE